MARPKTLTDSERKSARVSVLMTPQMFDDVNTLAQIMKVSVSDLFVTLAAELIKKNRPAIDEVQQVVNKVSGSTQLSLFNET